MCIALSVERYGHEEKAMYRTIIIAALCGVIVVGSVIGGSYMIATAIRQAGDRQVNAIQQAGYEQSLATDRASASPAQVSEGGSGHSTLTGQDRYTREGYAAAAKEAAERYDQLKRDIELTPLSSYGRR
jgi:hypothetical protein